MAHSHPLLERYHAGQHAVVWRELIALGDLVRSEPWLPVATAVCEEVIRRASFNLRLLHQRLLDLGYVFAEPDAALQDASTDAAQSIDDFERDFGTIPLIARLWYMTFDSVNFSQADSQRVCLSGGIPAAGPDINGLGSHPVLQFHSLSRSREQFIQLKAEHEHHVQEARQNGYDYPREFGSCLFLGGWASNCDPKGFELPDAGIDGIIFNDGGGDVYFVDELRHAFQWGGFPFWQRLTKKPKFYSPLEYRPHFAKLLPILSEGLVEL
jgi:hypothetical protein